MHSSNITASTRKRGRVYVHVLEGNDAHRRAVVRNKDWNEIRQELEHNAAEDDAYFMSNVQRAYKHGKLDL